MDRRQFLASAAALGVIGIWASRSTAAPSRIAWREDRALYPQGVASGDPDAHSVVLWTRRPFEQGEQHVLTVEVARDATFRRVVATARVPVLAAADWTCRAIVGGLLPATVYWYRFTDDAGTGSRIGRTITAPRATRFSHNGGRRFVAASTVKIAIMLELFRQMEARAHSLDERVRNSITGAIEPCDASDTLAKPCYDYKGLSRTRAYLEKLTESLRAVGIDVYQIDHEDANGQFEINFNEYFIFFGNYYNFR
eukprot:gene30001-39823_t